MESRRELVYGVTHDGLSLSEACRRCGVSRKTGRKWVERAKTQGLDRMSELSRAPKNVSGKTDVQVERKLLELKHRYPEWGARKLVVLLERDHKILLPSRTADHILSRNGLTSPKSAKVPLQRFERPSAGSLLQMDFKGLPKTCPYSLLTVLDDYGRYCLAFEPVPDKTGPSVQRALWEVFGVHGLPESMLMDNGDCWGSIGTKSVTQFEAWLMLLGIKPIHGRPLHPQTQGKVERFHGTAKRELAGQLVQPSIERARPVMEAFVNRYNWIRPHDALGGDVPASRYNKFERQRPERMPQHEIPIGALTRGVDARGYFSFGGKEYRIGAGLVKQRVVLQEDMLGMRVFFAGFPLAYLVELRP